MGADVAKWVLFLSLAVSIPSGAAAQEATFTGTITDQTGGVLPGVTVTAIHDTSGNVFVAVTDGRITRQGDAQARLLRDNVVVWEGKLASLKRFKDDVSEVKAGFECGMGLQNFNDVKVGDVIEVFQMERVAQPVGS